MPPSLLREAALGQSSTLYATETSEAFSTAKLYATGGERFSGTTDYHKPGTYYFFLAADVDATAPAGARITITPRSITAGGEERVITTPPTSCHRPPRGMHGDFTIGERRGMHYTTLTAAIQDLVSRGVDGPVRLLLSAGTYDEALSLPDIAGLSETNTLTIEPISGRRGEVTLTNTHYRKVDYGDNKPGYFNVEGADYVTLRALTFTSEKSDAPALLLVRNGSQHLTIDDCELSAPRTTLYNEGDMALIRTARGNQPRPTTTPHPKQLAPHRRVQRDLCRRTVKRRTPHTARHHHRGQHARGARLEEYLPALYPPT